VRSQRDPVRWGGQTQTNDSTPSGWQLPPPKHGDELHDDCSDSLVDAFAFTSLKKLISFFWQSIRINQCLYVAHFFFIMKEDFERNKIELTNTETLILVSGKPVGTGANTKETYAIVNRAAAGGIISTPYAEQWGQTWPCGCCGSPNWAWKLAGCFAKWSDLLLTPVKKCHIWFLNVTSRLRNGRLCPVVIVNTYC